MKFDGKTVLVTGGASGIGEATVKRFAIEGANVVVNYFDNKEAADIIVADIIKAGGKAIAVYGDVTSSKDVQDMVDTTVKEFGTIDILVNSAGAFDNIVKMQFTTEEEWDRIIDVDLKGIFLTCKYSIPYMLENKEGGVIINIASAAGLLPGGGGVAYTSAKHGVIGLTREICFQYALDGIRANTICPGLIETPMTADLMGIPEVMEGVKNNPAGRVGQPDEIANAVLYLASKEAEFIQGSNLVIDGGWFIRH